MAAKKKPRNKELPPETLTVGRGTSRGLQWTDLDEPGQQALQGLMNGLGNPAAGAGKRLAAMGRAAASETNNPRTIAKNVRDAANLKAFRPHLRKVDMSLQGAADRRTEHFNAGVLRSVHEDVDPGHKWFFQHRAANADIAEEHGFPIDSIITAGAIQSPRNSPDNELAATRAEAGRMAGNEYIEKDLGRSGAIANRITAEAHLAGGPDTITPLGSPKVNAYANATSMSIPGGEIEREFDDRMNHAITHVMGQPHQKSLDLWGLQQSGEGILDSSGASLPSYREGPLVDSKEGPLNPEANTPEDTWMNSVTMGQRHDIRTPGGATASKFVGSDKLGTISKKVFRGVSAHPNGAVSTEALQHAWNNQATIMSARDIGLASGSVDSEGNSNLPVLGVHPTIWTEARRRASQDPAYNKIMRNRAAGNDAEYNASRAEDRKNPPAQPVSITPKRNPQQSELF